MKELVLSGCSMTADYITHRNKLKSLGDGYHGFDESLQKYIPMEWKILHRHSIPVEIIGKHFGLKPIDLSNPGSGNLQIYNRLADYVMRNHRNIDLVIACWSSFMRCDLETCRGSIINPEYTTLIYSDYKEYHRSVEDLRDKHHIWKMLIDHGFLFAKKDIDQFFRNSIALDALCKSYDIELVQCASIMTAPLPSGFIATFIDHPLHAEINKMNFYGWPIFWDLGGKGLFNFLNNEGFISEFDKHPNKRGHELVSKKLIDFICERGIYEK